MKVSGFTIVRNAIKYDYPIVEAITSILPLCDEFIVSVGNSDDDTLALIQSIDSPKIKIVQSMWDDTLREGGRVLAVETDKAYQHIAPDADWAFYIQADEVVHEQYHANIRAAMQQYKDDKQVDGLLFNYLHFYGSYSYVADAYNWYRKEIRIVRKRNDIYSHGDAQGFRKGKGEKLDVLAALNYCFEHLKIKDLYVIGWSFGTELALQYARDERIKELILLSPPMLSTTQEDLDFWIKDGRVITALIPELDDYLKPDAARLKFSKVKNLKQIDVAGAKHLWVGEPMVHLVLSEIVKVIAPSRLPLPQEI